MECKDFLEKVCLYPEVEEDFYQHLKVCSVCYKRWEEWLNIESFLLKPYLPVEIKKGWQRVSTLVYERIQQESRRKTALVVVLSLTGSILSTYFIIYLLGMTFINNQEKVALPLIFHGLKTIWTQISYPFHVGGVILLVILSIYSELNRVSNRLDGDISNSSGYF